MEYIFAPITTTDKLEFLQMLIQDFLAEFTHLYPERPLTPKMHYLVHMPSWMKRLVSVATTTTVKLNISSTDINRCGPLIRNWCMRFEAKHSYFKKMAQTLGSYKNVAKTVSTRHQYYKCYKMACSVKFLGVENTYGSGNVNST